MTSESAKIIPGSGGIVVLDAAFDNVRRDRDFGRVEANVTLYVKQTGQAVRPVCVKTNVMDRGAETLRARLLQDAANLARYVLARQTLRGLDHAA